MCQWKSSVCHVGCNFCVNKRAQFVMRDVISVSMQKLSLPRGMSFLCQWKIAVCNEECNFYVNGRAQFAMRDVISVSMDKLSLP